MNVSKAEAEAAPGHAAPAQEVKELSPSEQSSQELPHVGLSSRIQKRSSAGLPKTARSIARRCIVGL
jgi:hypothetical protein